MDWSGWALFGFAATLALTLIMAGAQMGGLSRMDIPFMLGTMVSAQPDTARVAGFFLHLVAGQFYALFYAAAFGVLDRDAWWLGAGFGAFHGLVALMVIVPLLPGVHRRMASDRAGPELTASLEPPGFLGLNYGRETATVTLIAHLLYGTLLAVFLTPSS